MFGITSALDTLLALQEAVEAARTSDFFGISTTSRGTYPSINLFQDGDNTVLMAELPGVKKEDIKIQIKDKMITLSGERKIEYPENSSTHRLERRGFKFNRSMKLPTKVDLEKVNADYNDGILKIVMPRAEGDKPKLIDIN